MIWPADGLFFMPQAMAWGMKAPEELFRVGEYLLSRPVQEFLSMQSFVPASEETPLHPMLVEKGCDLRWKGWETFFRVMKDRKR
jgi:hypothetical protein